MCEDRSQRLSPHIDGRQGFPLHACCAFQVAEEGLSRVVADFGSREYLQRELNDLADQLERIRTALEPEGNWL